MQISPLKITNTFSLSHATRALGGGGTQDVPPSPPFLLSSTKHGAHARVNAHAHERAQGWLRL